MSSEEFATRAGGENTRPAFDPPDLVLVADFVEAASDLSTLGPASMFDRDVLGLSVFPLPGILDRIEPRKDRKDSLVSDLLKDGYDCSPSPSVRSGKVVDSAVGAWRASFCFEGCWPIPTSLFLMPPLFQTAALRVSDFRTAPRSHTSNGSRRLAWKILDIRQVI